MMFETIRRSGRSIYERWFHDADAEAIYRYIDGELKAEEISAFEQRMLEDQPFFDKASSAIKLWRHGLPAPRGSVEDEARILQAARERLWHHGRSVLELPAAPYDASRMTALVRDGDE